MIPEIGHYLLILAAVTALTAPLAVLWGVRRGDAYLTDFWKPALAITATALLGAATALVWAFVTDDFSVAYVANNSNTKLEAAYKVAALWSSHEGSMLLWIVLMALGAAALPLFRCADRVFTARLQAIALWVTGGFSLFLIATSNPFLRILPLVPPEGRDLNPVLQDIGMILHPPVLFMGYSGLGLMFAAMAALLLSGRWEKEAVRIVTRIAALTWGFLTAGNMLGSWWAYTELGWGGWWFWDPVENASFIPWLTTTALLHALIQTRRRGQLRRLSVFLTLFSFALCLLGTLIVRSGLMQSVHAFASDPQRGTALFLLSCAILLPAVLLYALRIESVCRDAEEEVSGEDTLMTAGVFLLVVAAFGVLFGTLYPLGFEMVSGKTLTVGAPYFNSFFAPMALLAALLVGAAHLGLRSLLRWGVCGAVSVAGAALTLCLTEPRDPMWAAASVAAALWILTTFAAQFLPGARRLSIPALVAHAGIAVSILGAVGVGQYESEALVRMGPGLGKPVEDVVFVYTETRPVDTPSYYGKKGVIEVLDAETETLLTVLEPERQTFVASGMQMSEAGIDHGIWRDLYVSLGNPLSDTEWLVRLSVKPLAGWIWSGGVLMILACALLFFRRRRSDEVSR